MVLKGDLSTISGEIKHLQDQSMTLSIQLRSNSPNNREIALITLYNNRNIPPPNKRDSPNKYDSLLVVDSPDICLKSIYDMILYDIII